MFSTIVLALAVLSSPASSMPSDQNPDGAQSIVATQVIANPSVPVSSESELQLALRDLWNGHIFWVRNYVLASHYGNQTSADAADAKAVENARALADAIVPLYGQDAADQLFGLLAGHYGGIKAYSEAYIKGSDSGKNQAMTQITENATEIADFLDAANPYLPKKVVLPLLMAHGGHHVQQIDAFGRDAFDEEGAVWDAMLAHIYAISDAMSAAFVKQFPDKFGAS